MWFYFKSSFIFAFNPICLSQKLQKENSLMHFDHIEMGKLQAFLLLTILSWNFTSLSSLPFCALTNSLNSEY